jgi:hypothetical protein
VNFDAEQTPAVGHHQVAPIYSAGFITAFGAHAVAANLGVYAVRHHSSLWEPGLLLAGRRHDAGRLPADTTTLAAALAVCAGLSSFRLARLRGNHAEADIGPAPGEGP